MKTISIGDIHGRLDWKVIDPNKYDKIIFVGDYTDSFTISDSQITNNLLDIIQFKKDNLDKVILLWGNHDLQYLFNYNGFGCTGYRPQMYKELNKIFNDNKNLFQMSYEYGNTIWTHAGIHERWFKYHFKYFIGDSISERLNNAFNIKYNALFNIGYVRGGYHSEGGPFWADITELKANSFRNMNQIVGHNRVEKITKIYNYNKEVVFIDTLEYEKTDTLFYEKDVKKKKT